MNKNILSKKSLFILLVTCITFIFIFPCVKVNAYSLDNDVQIENKKVCNATLDDNFVDDTIIVTLTNSASLNFKEYNTSSFLELSLLEVRDSTIEISEKIKSQINKSTSITNDMINSNTNFDITSFRTTLVLKLANPSKTTVLDYIKILEDRNDVYSAEPNYIGKFESTVSNDSFENEQWAINYLELQNAWDITTGTNEVRVGILDSGIDRNHPDLTDNVNQTLSRDFSGSGNPWYIDYYHGTHVAGIVGAVGNNSIGVSGANWNVQLISLKVGETAPTAQAVADAINYANANNIRILNLSLTVNETTSLVNAIESYNGIIICAAGNSGNSAIGYPARLNNPKIISVGALESDGSRWIYSNFGDVDIWAPGANILNAFPRAICQEHNIMFNDGTFLCEMHEVNITYLYSLVESGEYTWKEIIDNFETIFRYPPSHFINLPHEDIGYHYLSGTSMATPYVTGVAALLLSLNETLTTAQLREAIIESAVDIQINVGGTATQDVVRLNAYNAVKYVLEHFSNIEYTLGNYSSSINTNKTIVSGDSYFNNKNGFYKLNVTYAKNYEFNISSNQNLNVILYDEDFSEVSYTDFDSSNNKTHFIQNLSVGTYYLRTQYENEEASGTINTKINSRTTTYLNYGTNNILLNTYNDIVDYYYINERGAGFFKFTVEGTKTDGTTVSLPANALKIYNDSGKLTPMDKFTVTGVSNAAQNKLGENSIITYLPRNGYFYLDIDVSSTDLKSLTINISKVESQEIDLFDLNEDENSTISVLNNSSKGDYIKTLNIEQTGKFTISYNYNGGLTDSFLFILAKQNYNSSTNQYSLTTLVVQLMDGTNDSFTYTGNLEAGKYYIGYLNKNDNSSVVSNFVRYVTLSGEEVLVTDPDQGTPCGSQINIIERNHSNKSYRQSFITVGFTRLIYPNYNYGISPSRLDYDWYSSNTSIATVTNYGTVLGKSAGTVKIMAVLKSDPSKVFVKEFTIINDIGSGIVEIHSTYTVKYSRDVVNGKFHFDIEKINCPYPWLQDYTWSLNNNCHGNSIGASMDNWGDITINGTGCFTLTGTYNVNSRYRVIIHFVIEP